MFAGRTDFRPNAIHLRIRRLRLFGVQLCKKRFLQFAELRIDSALFASFGIHKSLGVKKIRIDKARIKHSNPQRKTYPVRWEPEWRTWQDTILSVRGNPLLHASFFQDALFRLKAHGQRTIGSCAANPVRKTSMMARHAISKYASRRTKLLDGPTRSRPRMRMVRSVIVHIRQTIGVREVGLKRTPRFSPVMDSAQKFRPLPALERIRKRRRQARDLHGMIRKRLPRFTARIFATVCIDIFLIGIFNFHRLDYSRNA